MKQRKDRIGERENERERGKDYIMRESEITEGKSWLM